MCFEFEWLYWAQLAQEEDRRREQLKRDADASLVAVDVRLARRDPQRSAVSESPIPIV